MAGACHVTLVFALPSAIITLVVTSLLLLVYPWRIATPQRLHWSDARIVTAWLFALLFVAAYYLFKRRIEADADATVGDTRSPGDSSNSEEAPASGTLFDLDPDSQRGRDAAIAAAKLRQEAERASEDLNQRLAALPDFNVAGGCGCLLTFFCPGLSVLRWVASGDYRALYVGVVLFLVGLILVAASARYGRHREHLENKDREILVKLHDSLRLEARLRYPFVLLLRQIKGGSWAGPAPGSRDQKMPWHFRSIIVKPATTVAEMILGQAMSAWRGRHAVALVNEPVNLGILCLEENDGEWQNLFMTLADEAACILLVCDASQGILNEAAELGQRNDWLLKSVIVWVPGTNPERWRAFAEKIPCLRGREEPTGRIGAVLTFARSNDGGVEAECEEVSASDEDLRGDFFSSIFRDADAMVAKLQKRFAAAISRAVGETFARQSPVKAPKQLEAQIAFPERRPSRKRAVARSACAEREPP